MSDENESEDVSEKRITLLAILEAFNAPIKFDQAWAIIYIVSLFLLHTHEQAIFCQSRSKIFNLAFIAR